MVEWYNALSDLSKCVFILGTVMGVFLIIQVIMLIAGFDGDTDIDPSDGILELAGLKIISIRTIVIFLCIGSWVTFILDGCNAHPALSIIIGVLSGALAAFIFAFALAKAMKLQNEGNIVFNNAIGKDAEVYLTIPSDNTRLGKITLLVQERMIEMDAKSQDGEELKTGVAVEVIDVINNIAIVRRK